MKSFIPDNISKHDNVFDVLKERGFIEQCTDEDAVRELLGKEKIKFYIGFDPTADCLHVGHFMQVIAIMYMQKFGHTPVVLLGGGTGMVGDPSGRSDMRTVMDVAEIDNNCNQFKKLFDRFIEFDEEWQYTGNQGVYCPGKENKTPEAGKAIAVNNGEWIRPLNFVEFVREVGSKFNVNNMLRAEAFKQRMEREGGLTFFEFSYMLMQSYDFMVMARDFDVRMEFGGDDQWSNIIGGVHLTRKMVGKEVYGMTFSLLTTSEGKKMGKTQKGALWLDPNRTSPFDHHLPAHATRTDRSLQEVTIGRLSRSHCNRHRAHTGKLRIGIMNCGSFCTRSGRISCILLIASTHDFTVFEQHGRSHTKMGIGSITRLRSRLSRFDQTHIDLSRNINSGSQDAIRKMKTGLFHWVVKIDNGLTANLLIIFSATNVIRLVSPEIPV